MRILLSISLLLCSSCAYSARRDTTTIQPLIAQHVPAQAQAVCRQLLLGTAELSELNADEIEKAKKYLYDILTASEGDLSDDVRQRINDVINRGAPVREPRDPRPDLPSQEEADGVLTSNDASPNFAQAGGAAFNSGTAAGFNFATDNGVAQQANQSTSFNLSTYGSITNTQQSDDINIATGQSNITSIGHNANFNVATSGSIQNNEESRSVSFVAGDNTTRVSTRGSQGNGATAFNVVTGKNTQLALTDTSKPQESINFVTAGAQASNPANGINLYPGNNIVRVFGPIDMQSYEIRNVSISANTTSSDGSVAIVYDTDDSNSTSNTDEAFNVREGSANNLAFRVDKNSASLHGRPLNANRNALTGIATIAGAQNRNVRITSAADSSQSAHIILEPGIDSGAGHLELRNIGSGTGAPLVINNGVVQVESSSHRYKRDIQTCSSDTSDALLKLRPVSYLRFLGQQFREYGLIAEEVAQVLPELVVYEPDQGTPESISYHQMIALLLHILQKHQTTIEHLESRISELEEQQEVRRT